VRGGRGRLEVKRWKIKCRDAARPILYDDFFLWNHKAGARLLFRFGAEFRIHSSSLLLKE